MSRLMLMLALPFALLTACGDKEEADSAHDHDHGDHEGEEHEGEEHEGEEEGE